MYRLSDVVLDSASDEDFGGSKIVMSVEQCVCPPNYIGLSCEECAPGYYRSTTGSHGGFCVPCQCNNHADICDKSTGKCTVSFRLFFFKSFLSLSYLFILITNFPSKFRDVEIIQLGTIAKNVKLGFMGMQRMAVLMIALSVLVPYRL